MKRTEAIKWVQGVVKSLRITLIPLISEHFSQWKPLAMAHIERIRVILGKFAIGLLGHLNYFRHFISTPKQNETHYDGLPYQNWRK